MADSRSGIVERIKRHDLGRDGRLLALKYAEMRESAFRFYRGTCHLFYEDWASDPPVRRSPLAWVSGDLHPENFGSYRGADGGVYFDVNDFDEAALGPCVWDVARCMTGIWVGASELGILRDDVANLDRRYLYAYCTSLGDGSVKYVDASDASGMVRELLSAVAARPEGALVKERTTGKRRKRRIVVDGVHANRATSDESARASRLIARFNDGLKPRRRYEVLDVAQRLAGTGSLGVARFIVLAQQQRSLHLLDCKAEPVSSLAPFLESTQPRWRSDAARVVGIQSLAETAAPRPLEAIVDGPESFVVKELQPYADRVRWERWHGRLERLEHLMSAMGQVTAWSHLRGAGWRGAAKKRELASFASDRAWPHVVAEYARAYAARVDEDFRTFSRAFDAGRFKAGRG